MLNIDLSTISALKSETVTQISSVDNCVFAGPFFLFLCSFYYLDGCVLLDLKHTLFKTIFKAKKAEKQNRRLKQIVVLPCGRI